MPLLGFALASIGRGAAQYAAAGAGAVAGVAARRRLRSVALGGVLRAGPAAIGDRPTGELVALLVDAIEGLDGFYRSNGPATALALAGPLLVGLAVLGVDWHAALVLGGTGLAVPVGQAVFGIGAARASARQFDALARLQHRFLDRVRGISTLVLSGAAEREATALGVAADELRRRTMQVLRVAFLSASALDAALVVALVGIAVLDRHVLAGGGSTPGASARALFPLLAVPEFFAPLRAYALSYQDRHRLDAAATLLATLPTDPTTEVAGLATTTEPGTPPLAAPAIRTVAAHGVAVAFEDVRFAWRAGAAPVFDGLSFRVPPGETALLIGPSGSGKSTAIDLLLGFNRAQGGRITLNGAPIETIVPAALSRLTGWIGQRPVLFAGTVAANIRFARPDASEAEFAAAVRAARLEPLLATLPDGADTRIGEGGWGLSGGEAQRVAVARAFLRDAPLLLLDEPTAHLDPATEGELLESLRRLVINRTVILASHSTAAHAFAGRRVVLGPLGGQTVRAVVGA